MSLEVKTMLYECSCGYATMILERHLLGREGWVHVCPNIIYKKGMKVRCCERISYLKLLMIMKLTNEYKFGDEKIEKMLELGDVLK